MVYDDTPFGWYNLISKIEEKKKKLKIIIFL